MTAATLNTDTKTLYRSMAKVALPISVQGLITSSLTLVDNLMVGSLGEGELAAVGVAANYFFVYYLICYGFCGGCATFLAQFYGAKDYHHIRKTMGFMILVCAAVAVLFFVLACFTPITVMRLFTNIPEILEIGKGYMHYGSFALLCLGIIVPGATALRSIQRAHIPLVTSTISFVTNTVLNYILIFGKFGAPRLGVEGAAIATTIARLLEAIIILVIISRSKGVLAGGPQEFFGWTGELLRRVIKNALPTTLNESLWGLGVTVYAAAFARVSVTAYAAVQASIAINDLFQMAALGLGDASLILIGQKLGENRLSEAKVYAKKFLRAGLVVGILLGALLILFGNTIAGLFDFTPDGARYTRYILIIFGCTLVVELLNAILVTGVLRSGGDTRFALFADVGTVWLWGVPMAFLTALVWRFPIHICMGIVMGEAVIKLTIVYYRYRQMKWVRNMVHDLSSGDS